MFVYVTWIVKPHVLVVQRFLALGELEPRLKAAGVGWGGRCWVLGAGGWGLGAGGGAPYLQPPASRDFGRALRERETSGTQGRNHITSAKIYAVLMKDVAWHLGLPFVPMACHSLYPCDLSEQHVVDL